uniref:Uncharacterized protein n=1 Tax=Meloidogyne floridensis TaxID=298350 RepID=A0A915NHD7_9BILA
MAVTVIKKIGRSKSEKDTIELSKIEIENLKNKKEELEKELLNLKSEIIEINENNEQIDLKGKRRVKSFNDFYPIPADRKISFPKENANKVAENMNKEYYGFDSSLRSELYRKEAAERRKKKQSSRTNSASTSNSNTKPSTSANTESDKANCSKSNEIENSGEITEILPGNCEKYLQNYHKASFEIETIREEIPVDINMEKKKKEIKEGKKIKASLSDSEIEKPSHKQKMSKLNKHSSKTLNDLKEKFIKLKRFSSLKSFSSKEIKLGGNNKKEKVEETEQRSFSETNLKEKYLEENKSTEKESLTSLPEYHILFPETR